MSLLSRLAVQAARAYGMLVAGSANNVSADYLVVAGGGGGGGGHGGGGGAGGFRTSTATLSTLNTYSIAVGAGGLGGINYSDPTSRGSSGSDSSISGTGLSTVTSTGGGGGGGYATNSGIGASGGSGGGGAGQTTSAGGSGTSGQGNSGGSGVTSAYAGAGGGGGASASGGNGSGTVGGTGGAGTASSISGSSVTYAGGGGGGIGVSATGGTGGAGGGGNGSSNGGTTAGGNGTVNTGGGGGGGGGDFPMNFRGGTGGSGIVIISYTSATPKFVGGTITTSGGKQIHTFTSSGTLSPITPITASYLVVAGGAGGGFQIGGGGGAGGYKESSTTLYSGATYVVTVGAGGAGDTASGGSGSNGSNSELSGTGLTTITSTGGGGGASNSGGTAQTGGSGGGGRGSVNGAAGTSGQGFAGGNGSTDGSTYTNAGGGGGASAVGSNATSSTGGNGGTGTASSITGTSTTYAGGGGGGAQNGGSRTAGTATGGGGAGGLTGAGSSGTPNLGAGGGGGGENGGTGYAGGNGGSGIVIISYAGSQQFNGGLVTSSGGNTIHTFTSTGALTPLTNNLNNSLRFRSSASAYLSRTPTVAGNQQKWTWSAWVKRSTLTSTQVLFATSGDELRYIADGGASGVVDSFQYNLSTGTYGFRTNATYRDVSAWYHIVVAVDTTQAIAANRARIYINGNEASTDGTYGIVQNANTQINSAVAHNIARRTSGSLYFDGYMTDINFIDGQQLEPYYFGNNDANGVWKPIQYKGTYGTNGFYLTFGNTTSTTTLGYDSSPNGNNWTCNNISLTAGTTYDAMTDVPTNTSATVANYCTLNPIATNTVGVGTLSNANLNFSIPNTYTAIGTMSASSGKYYWEAVATSNAVGIGLKQVNVLDRYSNTIYYMGVTLSAGEKYVNGTGSAYGASWTTGDVIGVAVDMDGATVTFYKNNASQGSIALSLATITEFVPSFVSGAGATFDGYVNFGQRPFTYTPPTGYVALNTYNLPTPTILQGNKYMDANLWTGNGLAQTIVNQGQFKPDFVWVKQRNSTAWHSLVDAVRGVTKYLYSNTTDVEGTQTTLLTSFNSNGFSLSSDSNVNGSGSTYVGWQWQAGQGSTSSNTSGSITSTVSVNTTAGFSVVTYTGNGTAGATVGHGLGVSPAMTIIKSRLIAANSWCVWQKSFSTTQTLYLDSTTALLTRDRMTGVSSTTFTIGSHTEVNTNASTYVAYCFAEIAGFSKFGSYTGNGSADGPFVYLGFRPKYVMIKRTDSADDWIVMDSARNTYNVANSTLFPNGSYAETTDANRQEDFLSNGFKVRSSPVYINASGGTYIYAAFAENPFKNSNAR